MRVAVLIATSSSLGADEPAALLLGGDGTLLDRLIAQLEAHGVDRTVVITASRWAEHIEATLGPTTKPVAVAPVDNLGETFSEVAKVVADVDWAVIGYGDVITHNGAIAGLLNDTRITSGLLATGGRKGARGFRARMTRGRATSAESPYHQITKSTTRGLGLLKIDRSDLEELQAALAELEETAQPDAPPAWDEELARKVKVWAGNFMKRHSPTLEAANQFERLDTDQPWLPRPDEIRDEVSDRFKRTVLHRAEVARNDAVAVLTTALVRRNVYLKAAYLRQLYWARPYDQEAAARAVAALARVDEDKVLLNSAVKANDGFFTTFFVSPYSKYIAKWAARMGLTPNQVTVFSLLLGVGAAANFAAGTRPGLIVGAILLQLAFTFDCVDGQLARYTRDFSNLGAWLDSVFDRAKEYVVFAGLAIGGFRAGLGHEIWVLAAAALTVQTVRHLLDFSYAASKHEEIATLDYPDISMPWDNISRIPDAELPTDGEDDIDTQAQGSDDEEAGETEDAPETVHSAGLVRRFIKRLGKLGVKLSRRFERRRWMKWAKRMVVFPIGERFATISLVAAIWNPRVVFIVLLVWGGFATLYALAGRVLRSVA